MVETGNTSSWASPELEGSMGPGAVHKSCFWTRAGFCLLCLERSMLTWCLIPPFTGDNWKPIVVIITIKPKIHVSLMTCKISCVHSEEEISGSSLTGRWLATHSCWLFLAEGLWVGAYTFASVYLAFSYLQSQLIHAEILPARSHAMHCCNLSFPKQTTNWSAWWISIGNIIFRVPPQFRFKRTGIHHSLLYMLTCQAQALSLTPSLAIIFTNTISHRTFCSF